MRVYDPERTGDHVGTEFGEAISFFRKGCHRSTRHVRLSSSVENLLGHDPRQSSAHEGAPLSGTHELFAWYGAQEFQKISIEIWITPVVRGVVRKHFACDLSSQGVKRGCTLLETWQGSEEFQPALIACKRDSITSSEVRMNPERRPSVFRNGDYPMRKEMGCGFEQ